MNSTNTSLKSTAKAFGQILFILAGIQVLRMSLQAIFWMITTRMGWSESLQTYTDPVVYLLVAGILFALVRPKPADVGLTPLPGSKAKIAYILFAILLTVFLVAGGFLNQDLFYGNLRSCLVFPLFEEPIFRGWAWQKLEKTLPARKWTGMLLAVLSAALFSIWHIGYWDVVAHHMQLTALSAELVHVMLMKMLVTAIIGLGVGLVRWRGGNIYPALLLHAFWNLFGR